MDLTTALREEEHRLAEPPHRNTVHQVVLAGRRARNRRRVVRGTVGVAALLAAGGVVVSLPHGGNPDGPPFASGSSPSLRTCGADFEKGRVVVAPGVTVLRRVDGAIDPAVAPHSIALDLRLPAGAERWVVWGWDGSGGGGGCDDPTQPGTATTFDGYLRLVRDGDGISLGQDPRDGMSRGVSPEDEDAFTEYVAARRDHLRRIALAVAGDWHSAEDLLQTALVKLYLAWPRMGHDGREDGYVRRILVRAHADERRRPWRRERAGLLDQDPARFAVEPPEPTGSPLLDAVLALPPMQRKVVALRYWCDLSVEQTADELGISTGTVKSHAARAVARLEEVARGPSAAGTVHGLRRRY